MQVGRRSGGRAGEGRLGADRRAVRTSCTGDEDPGHGRGPRRVPQGVARHLGADGGGLGSPPRSGCGTFRTRSVSRWSRSSTRSPGRRCSSWLPARARPGSRAAARLGDDGRLISTDFSAPMVEAARRRAEELGLSNVEFQVMDAERMSLADDSVDGVLCRWGYMLMADPAGGAGRRLAVSSATRGGPPLPVGLGTGPDDNQWAVLPRRALSAVPPGICAAATAPGDPGIFAMSQRGADPRAGHRPGGARRRSHESSAVEVDAGSMTPRRCDRQRDRPSELADAPVDSAGAQPERLSFRSHAGAALRHDRHGRKRNAARVRFERCPARDVRRGMNAVARSAAA